MPIDIRIAQHVADVGFPAREAAHGGERAQVVAQRPGVEEAKLACALRDCLQQADIGRDDDAPAILADGRDAQDG